MLILYWIIKFQLYNWKHLYGTKSLAYFTKNDKKIRRG